jgi:hypothetical protein
MYYPFTQVVHAGGESAATDGSLTDAGRQISALQIESELLYFRKHYGVVGVLTGTFLTVSSDMINAGAGLLRRWDTARTLTALKHSWNVLKLLFVTRLASRPTH